MSSRICLVNCGGTIAASHRLRGFIAAGDLLEAYGLGPYVPEGVEVVAVDHDSRSSTEWTASDALRLARLLQATSDAGEFAGIVVTFGTGTLEETAYLAHLTVRPAVPVVFTAAQAPHGAPDGDGGGNLLDALRVAASAVPPGVYVVLHGDVHDPREVVKVHANRIDAFASPEFGALGSVEDGRVRLFRTLPPTAPVALDSVSARVELIKCYQGMDGLLVGLLDPRTVQGLVVETLASGQVPPGLAPALIGLVAKGVTVALSTRCLMGRIRRLDRFPVQFAGDEKQLLEAGCLAAFEPGTKARVRLLVGLARGWKGAELRTWFEGGYDATAC